MKKQSIEAKKALRRIQLDLNENEISMLQEIAKGLGYKDYRTWLYRQIHSLPTLLIKDIKCNKEAVKIPKPITLSEEAEAFYTKLSCSHSTTITSVIHKFIIYPALKLHMIQ